MDRCRARRLKSSSSPSVSASSSSASSRCPCAPEAAQPLPRLAAREPPLAEPLPERGPPVRLERPRPQVAGGVEARRRRRPASSPAAMAPGPPRRGAPSSARASRRGPPPDRAARARRRASPRSGGASPGETPARARPPAPGRRSRAARASHSGSEHHVLEEERERLGDRVVAELAELEREVRQRCSRSAPCGRPRGRATRSRRARRSARSRGRSRREPAACCRRRAATWSAGTRCPDGRSAGPPGRSRARRASPRTTRSAAPPGTARRAPAARKNRGRSDRRSSPRPRQRGPLELRRRAPARSGSSVAARKRAVCSRSRSRSIPRSSAYGVRVARPPELPADLVRPLERPAVDGIQALLQHRVARHLRAPRAASPSTSFACAIDDRPVRHRAVAAHPPPATPPGRPAPPPRPRVSMPTKPVEGEMEQVARAAAPPSPFAAAPASSRSAITESRANRSRVGVVDPLDLELALVAREVQVVLAGELLAEALGALPVATRGRRTSVLQR